MEIIEFKSWADFRDFSSGVLHGEKDTELKSLFRGHADSDWKLETTLDREIGRFECESYYRMLDSFANTLASSLGIKNEIKEPDFNKRVYEDCNLSFLKFMSYARHLGFPSPLMDWTISPYVAAFFAFTNAKADGDIAIYMHKQKMISYWGKPEQSTCAYMYDIGDNFSSHQRHFLQQSRYTVAVEQAEGNYFFVPHEDIYCECEARGDVQLRKICMPANLADEVLFNLSAMNINAFSLFGTAEALAQASAYRLKRIFKR